jgi:hypothetical protein
MLCCATYAQADLDTQPLSHPDLLPGIGTTPASAVVVSSRFSLSKLGDMVYDHSTGLFWGKCSVGQLWLNNACQGVATKFVDAELRQFPKGDNTGLQWRVPTYKEADTITRLSSELFPLVAPVTTEDQYWTSDRRHDGKYLQYIRINLASGSFNWSYVNCGPGGCYGADKARLRVVASNADTLAANALASIFWFFDPSKVNGLASQIGTVRLDWMKGTDRPQVTTLPRLQEATLARILVVKTHEKIAADSQLVPTVRQLPEKVSASASILTKGEFETSAIFEERVRKSNREAVVNADSAYQNELTLREQDIKLRDFAINQIKQRLANSEFKQEIMVSVWNRLAPELLGDPMLADVTYDADAGVFEATLTSSRGSWSQKILAPVKISDAPRVKQDLISGKIAPKVTFIFPEMTVEWVLVENAAQRAGRFKFADSVSELERLILEFPASAEAVEAKKRVFVMDKTSKELAATLARIGNWPEAVAGRNRLPILQKQQFDKSSAENSSRGWQEFLDNFGGTDTQKLLVKAEKAKSAALSLEDNTRRREAEQWERDRPRRDARNLCEAQKQTCVASCPVNRYSDGSVMGPERSCRYRCESVSCQ